MGFFFGWIIFSIIVGAIGSNRKIGFAGAFFLSFFLSPLVGLIITVLSKSLEDEKRSQEMLETQKKQQKTLEEIKNNEVEFRTNTSPISIADEIEKLKKLKEEGTISQEEFESLRAKVIAG